MPSAADFFGSLIFGSIGLAALVYGKSAMLPKKMILGGVLMAYPYLISQVWLVWVIGSALTMCLITGRTKTAFRALRPCIILKCC